MRPGRFNDSSQTRSTSNFRSRCLGRERFTIAGVWTIATRWTFSFILTASKGARCWIFCKRTEFLIWLFALRFQAPRLVHTFTSVDHLTVTEIDNYES